MKFTSSEYLSQKRLDNGNPTNTSNNYKPRVKIPNYTTPLHSTSKHHNVYKSSEGVITQPQRNLITPPSNSRNGTSMPRQPMNNNRMPSDPTRRTTPLQMIDYLIHHRFLITECLMVLACLTTDAQQNA